MPRVHSIPGGGGGLVAIAAPVGFVHVTQDGTADYALTLGVTPASADLVIVGAATQNAPGPSGTVSCGGVSLGAQKARHTGANGAAAWWWGTGFTSTAITSSGTSTTDGLTYAVAMVVRATGGIFSLDGSGSAGQDGASPRLSSAIVTTVNGDIVLYIGQYLDFGTNNPTAISPAVLLGHLQSGILHGAASYTLQAAAGSIQPSITDASGGNGDFGAAAIKST